MVIYQLNDGKIPAYQTCMEQLRLAMPRSAHYVLMGTANHQPNCDDYRAASNILRCRLACKIDDMMWIDADVIVDKWPEIEWKKGKVYFITGDSGQPENWIFYVNGRCDFFRGMWEHFERTKPTDIWWFAKYVRAHKSDVEMIPKGHFTHLMLSRAVLGGDNFHEYSSARYHIKREKTTGNIAVEVK